MKYWKLAAATALVMSSNVQAATFVEDFEAPFPQWESDWLGVNSNIQNYYGIGADRGNNPDGLWIADGNGGDVDIIFDAGFGASITDFSIDTTTWVSNAVFTAYDMGGNILLTTAITSMQGAYTDPGSYQTIAFSTTNGMSGFSISGSSIEGNTSIDNVVVSAVPVPAAVWLFGSGLVGLAGIARRKKA